MLSKRTRYAIRALIYIYFQNSNNRRPLIREISSEIDAPPAFTAKILQTLARQKLVSSAKGRGGGFFFPVNVSEITIYDVINVIEGDGIFRDCGFGLKNCNDENPCPVHHKYKTVRDDFYKLVKEETIASLAQKVERGEAVLNNNYNN